MQSRPPTLDARRDAKTIDRNYRYANMPPVPTAEARRIALLRQNNGMRVTEMP